MYGGLIVPDEKISEIDEDIRRIRSENGYLNSDSLKFDTRTRPENVSIENFSAVKNSIVELAISKGCILLLYVVHHEIAKSRGLSTTIKWGADHIISKFHKFLEVKVEDGIVIVDRLSDTSEYGLFIEKFTTGLIYADKTVPLNKIKLFASSCDNASHLSSLADIVIGSFRYCINDPANFSAAKNMMGKLVKLIWATREGEKLFPFEKGLTFRPIPDEVTTERYKQDYDILLDHINSLLV